MQARMDGQLENIMPLVADHWQRHKAISVQRRKAIQFNNTD